MSARPARVHKRSAGLLVYRSPGDGIEVLIVHPGGPFWVKKDKGAWSIPKGELEHADSRSTDSGNSEGVNEAVLTDAVLTARAYATARREFEEEIGRPAPEGEPLDLGEIRQAGGKVVRAFALPFGDRDARRGDTGKVLSIRSNLVELEWPRGTGRVLTFPEVDRAEWASPETAREKLIASQVAFVDRLLEQLGT